MQEKEVNCLTVQCHEVLCEFVVNRNSCMVAGKSIMQLPAGLYTHTTFLLIPVTKLATL